MLRKHHPLKAPHDDGREVIERRAEGGAAGKGRNIPAKRGSRGRGGAASRLPALWAARRQSRTCSRGRGGAASRLRVAGGHQGKFKAKKHVAVAKIHPTDAAVHVRFAAIGAAGDHGRPVLKPVDAFVHELFADMPKKLYCSWIKFDTIYRSVFKRTRLDPVLYKLLVAHQA